MTMPSCKACGSPCGDSISDSTRGSRRRRRRASQGQATAKSTSAGWSSPRSRPRSLSLMVAAYAVLLCCLLRGGLVCTAENTPLALHSLVVVPAGGEVVVRLPGFDLDGDSLAYTIASLPKGGSLYQLSSIYSSYGYEPKQGTAITSGDRVSDGAGRVLYVPPAAASSTGATTFTYTVSESASSSQSQPGTVYLVPPSGALVSSDFALSHETWSVCQRTMPTSGKAAKCSRAAFEPSSRGLMSYFVSGSDGLIHADTASGDDSSLWSFKAPKAYQGNWGIAYGGQLSFDIGSFAGDFSSITQGHADLHIVELYCEKCAKKTGVTLAYPLTKTGGFDGRATRFSLPLKEGSGWLKDPENTLTAWKAPSKCELIEVLSGLTELRIAGDFTRWYETVTLDNVVISNAKGSLPACAQAAPDASVCTC